MKRFEQVRMLAGSRGRVWTFWQYTLLAPLVTLFLRNDPGMLLKTKNRGSKRLERPRNVFENKGLNIIRGMLKKTKALN